MSGSKLVSIIMPAYNSERYIAESIESVLVQTYQNWELIIVDDGSTDLTAEIVKEKADLDDRIKYFYQTNGKQGKARNTGIKNSKGELIAFLDSDDLWIPEKLEIQISFLEQHSIDLLFSDGYLFINNTSNTNGSFQIIKGYHQGPDAIELFLDHNRIPLLSVLTYKSIINKVGGFEESEQIQNVEDYHLWLKLLIEGYSVYGLDSKLVFYRQHTHQITVEDPWASEKVFYIFSFYLNLPKQFSLIILKARLRWARDWYLRNANNKKTALKILKKLFSSSNLHSLSTLTSISLVLFGVAFSKRVMKKLVSTKLKQTN